MFTELWVHLEHPLLAASPLYMDVERSRHDTASLSLCQALFLLALRQHSGVRCQHGTVSL